MEGAQTQQNEEALASDPGPARPEKDLMASNNSTSKEAASKRGYIEATDIEKLFTSNFDILFYDLQRDNLAYIWLISRPLKEVFFLQSEVKGIESSTNKSTLTVKSMENLVHKNYDKMKVREGVKCEDRSLGTLEGQDIEEEPVSSQVAEQNTTEERIIGNEEINKTDARCIYDEDHDDYTIPWEPLYDALIAPVRDKLVQDELVIIPDGALFMVPFAALQVPETGKFLSEIKRIRIAPSLTTLKVIQQSSDEQHYKSGALIIGNPEVGKVKFEGKEKSFSDLPGAKTEAIEIAKLLPGVDALTGRQATKNVVLEKLKEGVSVIHFATHGSENGKIVLAPSSLSGTNSIPDEQDFILTMKEAQESGVRAQLVVLSCCHSGRGEIKSEGVVGLSRAFLAAGAQAVVASLWAIADEATKVFMLKFYSHLKKGESASKSLQQAMKDMREIKEYREPRYWAAFFLIGDDVTIDIGSDIDNDIKS